MAIFQIQIRRGTSAEWATVNPVLAVGEFGLETDTYRIKIGTGSAVWTQLSYVDTGPPQTVASGSLANLTGPQQLQVTTGTLVATPDGRRWMYSGQGLKTAEASYLLVSNLAPDWSHVLNKPSAFPPSLATTTVVGGVLLADSTAITNGTAGRVVDAAQLKAGLDPKATTSALAMVATTGSYVDLLNTPSDFDGGNF